MENYDEFCKAMSEIKKQQDEEKLLKIFEDYEIDWDSYKKFKDGRAEVLAIERPKPRKVKITVEII